MPLFGSSTSENMSEIFAITSASGRQNAQLLPLLTSSKRFKLRLASHSEASASKLRMRYPGAEVVVVDLTSLDACRTLVQGATTVYHVGPSIHSREREMGFNMIDAATAEFQGEGSQFKHFVFSSVLGTQHRKLMQHDLKSFVEERLMLSPIPWTILQPTNFMDAYPVAHLASMETPVMERLWKPEMPNSMIALMDLAEVAAKVLTEREKHFYAQYPLCSTLPTTDTEVFEAISKRIGKNVQVKTPTFEVGVDNLLSLLFGTSSTLSAEGDLRPVYICSVNDVVSGDILWYENPSVGFVGCPTYSHNFGSSSSFVICILASSCPLQPLGFIRQAVGLISIMQSDLFAYGVWW